MPPAITHTLARLSESWQAAPRSLRRLVILGALAVALVAALVYAMNSVFVTYQILFANLSAEDAASVVEQLRQARVPYSVGRNGEVLVPEAQVHEWRLRLATQGMPSSGVGFEIFDKNQFGLTDFSQRLNFQRALQGELARTIAQLKEVQHARVHLALPAPRVFSSQDKPASASVVLRLRPGAALRADQIRGIVHLVTAAVEGLSPDRVTVLESSGRMLASGLDRVGALSASQQEARGLAEQDIERRIQTILDPIVGVGRSAVRVSALVNLDQIERTEERFDPKSMVRSQNKASEQTQGSSSQPTAPVEAAKTGEAPPRPAENSAATRTQRDTEQTTYEIARTIEKTVVTPGDVKRMSVAVLLDIPVVNGTRTPRPEAELERIKRLVASAAGVRAERNDEIEVQQLAFDPTAAPGEASPTVATPAPRPALRLPMWGYFAAAGIAVVVIAFVLWRARRRRSALITAVTAAALETAGSEEKSMAAPRQQDPPAPVDPLEFRPRSPEQETLKARVIAAAVEHPDQMAEILRAWMASRPRTA